MARNSSRAFRKVAMQVVARDLMLCGICGHPGAITVDHIIPHKDWPKDPNGDPLPGLDYPENLRAAHGTRGVGQHNRCFMCDPRGRLCNQSRGSGHQASKQERHSRPW